MAAHFHLAFSSVAHPQLGSTARLWMDLADRDPAAARSLVRTLGWHERAAWVQAHRPERQDKKRHAARVALVPVHALLLATKHPVLRQAVLAWPCENPPSSEAFLLVEDAIRRRDAEALAHWATCPSVATVLSDAFVQNAFPPEWLAALSAPCPVDGESPAVIRLLVAQGAHVKPLMRALASAGDAAGLSVLSDRPEARRILLGAHKSVGRHPAVSAFSCGHFALAHRLYQETCTAARETDPDNAWPARIRSGWLEVAASAFPATRQPDDRGARLAATQDQWVGPAARLLHGLLPDVEPTTRDALRARLLSLAQAGFVQAWSPVPGEEVGPAEWHQLLLGRAVPGSIDCLRAACAHHRRLLEDALSLKGSLARARQQMPPRVSPADWAPACTMATEGWFSCDILEAIIPEGVDAPVERAALFEAFATASLPVAPAASRSRM